MVEKSEQDVLEKKVEEMLQEQMGKVECRCCRRRASEAAQH